MRFMLLVIPDGYNDAPADAVPDAAGVEKMMEFNRSLEEAGVLLALDGLHPPARGARVIWKDGQQTVTDGPFAEAKEVLGGYWIIDVASREEAVEWARRVPYVGEDGTIEVRQIQEMEDFPPDVRRCMHRPDRGHQRRQNLGGPTRDVLVHLIRNVAAFRIDLCHVRTAGTGEKR